MLKPFRLDQLAMEDYYFIAHLLDRVLLGQSSDPAHNTLLRGIKDGMLIEAHFFNQEKELFVVQQGDELMAYRPLEHKEESQGVSRIYKLDPKWKKRQGEGVGYEALEIREYITNDKETNLAYVEKTVLRRLIREGETGR